MKTIPYKSRGFTLVELLVSMAIFGVLSVIIYSTFTSITNVVGKISEANTLSDKGQRILSFMEEDLRMAGYLIGAEAQVPYCTGGVTPTSPNAISHTSDNPYDTLTFLTAIPITLDETSACIDAQTDCPASGDPSAGGAARKDYYLTTRCDSGTGTTRTAQVYVDTGGGCYSGTDTKPIRLSTTAIENAKSLITFEAVAVGNGRSYYELNSVGDVLGLSTDLEQKIPDNSTVFGIRQYRYDVAPVPVVPETTPFRTLRRVAWAYDCDLDPTSLLEPSGEFGGVDGLKFEFTEYNAITNTMVIAGTPPNPLKNLKFVTIWLLIRSDRKSTGYTNTDTYTLGTSADKITLGPYNDSYRRLLVHKTVEVINFVSKT